MEGSVDVWSKVGLFLSHKEVFYSKWILGMLGMAQQRSKLSFTSSAEGHPRWRIVFSYTHQAFFIIYC